LPPFPAHESPTVAVEIAGAGDAPIGVGRLPLTSFCCVHNEVRSSPNRHVAAGIVPEQVGVTIAV